MVKGVLDCYQCGHGMYECHLRGQASEPQLESMIEKPAFEVTSSGCNEPVVDADCSSLHTERAMQ